MKEHRYSAGLSLLRSPFDLYAAISRVVPEAHGAGWAIAPTIAGFIIRGPSVPPGIKGLSIYGRDVRVDSAGTHDLESTRTLVSRCVLVRITGGAPVSEDELRRRVSAIVRERAAAIGVDIDLGAARGVRVHGRLLRGFAARATASTDEASLALQRAGIGGKRSSGCGVFCAEGSPWA